MNRPEKVCFFMHKRQSLQTSMSCYIIIMQLKYSCIIYHVEEENPDRKALSKTLSKELHYQRIRYVNG